MKRTVRRARALANGSSLPQTERVHPRSEDLDAASVAEVVARLQREDVAAVRAASKLTPVVAKAALAAAEALKRGGRLVYVGAGTSGRLGVLDAAECPPTFGTDPEQVIAVMAGGPRAILQAVEGAEDDAGAGERAMAEHRVTRRDFVVGISASGRTPFVLGALRAARRKGASTALVCCSRPPRATKADLVLFADTGPELIAGSTRLKAGTATKLVLNAISTAAMVALGKVHRGRMVSLRASNQKLRGRAKAMVAELAGVSVAAAEKLLERSGDQPAVALAMHFAGVPRAEAEVLVKTKSLRRLEREHRSRAKN
jgi:N-acetylmuramic acid 6-phosphate etherase